MIKTGIISILLCVLFIIPCKAQDLSVLPAKKTSILINPYRLFEGTLQASHERIFRENFSLKSGLMVTYASKDGMGTQYLRNQKMAYLCAGEQSPRSYSADMLTGWGFLLETKNYLYRSKNTNKKVSFSLYTSLQFMYRKIWILGRDYEYETIAWNVEPYYSEPTEITVRQNLDIGRTGLLIGAKLDMFDVVCVDIYVGGMLRLAKYYNEDHFTRYKQSNNIDYSGVLPVGGIGIGVLK